MNPVGLIRAIVPRGAGMVDSGDAAMTREWFYFAIPTRASRAARERVPAHLTQAHGIAWSTSAVELVRVDKRFRLYRIEREVTR